MFRTFEGSGLDLVQWRYERMLETKAGAEAPPRMPKLRRVPIHTVIIERAAAATCLLPVLQ